MAIEIRETFQIRAPIDAVWQFVMDPQQVVGCMPGAALEQVIDDRTFIGSVKVKVGAITTGYKGRVQFMRVDAQDRFIEMVAEGRETGGGMAKGTMSSRLRALPDGQTEVIAEASVDLTGRIMQVGRGMIQGVAHQLFLQFVASVKQRLEASQAAVPGTAQAAGPQAEGPAAAAPEPQAIRIVPIILKAMWAAILRFFAQLFRKPPART